MAYLILLIFQLIVLWIQLSTVRTLRTKLRETDLTLSYSASRTYPANRDLKNLLSAAQYNERWLAFVIREDWLYAQPEGEKTCKMLKDAATKRGDTNGEFDGF